MFSVFPSTPLSRRFSIILILAGPSSNMMAYLVCFQENESTASVRPVSSFDESAEPQRSERVLSMLLKTNKIGHHVTCWASQDEDDAKSTGQRRGWKNNEHTR